VRIFLPLLVDAVPILVIFAACSVEGPFDYLDLVLAGKTPEKEFFLRHYFRGFSAGRNRHGPERGGDV
jgi:hypothetical protein